MRSKTRSYIGVVFLALILAFVAFQMRDSVEVLQPVMPIIFVAFASLAVAGVAGFLFDLMESKLELPDWLGHGRLTLVGGPAVFIATLLIIINSPAFPQPAPAPTPYGTPVPQISVVPRVYLSSWADPRGLLDPNLQPEKQEKLLNKVWNSKIMLDATLGFRDRSKLRPGFVINEMGATLSIPGSPKNVSEKFEWECNGSRDDGITSRTDQDSDWYNCFEKLAILAVGADPVSQEPILKSRSMTWGELNAAVSDAGGEDATMEFEVAGDFPSKGFEAFRETITCGVPYADLAKLLQPPSEGVKFRPGIGIHLLDCVEGKTDAT